MEPNTNIRFICSGHIRPNEYFQTISPAVMVGDHVKIAFGGRKQRNANLEWMWVKVIDAGDKFCVGTIDSDPVIPAVRRRYRLGDIVAFEPREIAECQGTHE